MRARLFFFFFPFALFLFFALELTVEPARAQTAPVNTPQPIWNGVFTAAQAERGKVVVAARCTQCHGATRPLSDDLFMLHWEGHEVARLFQKIKTMPPKAVEPLSDGEGLDVLAYLLQQNGFPAGANE